MSQVSAPAHVLVDRRLLPKRFLVVSNRLPCQIDVGADGVVLKRGVGGLVTALDPILQATGGTWIGWSGNYEPVPERISMAQALEIDDDTYHLRPLQLSRTEVEQYYLGYANKALWPLLHYFQELSEFNRDHWRTYRDVNQRFVDAVLAEHQAGDLIWIHDYHLMLAPQMIRERIPDARIAFFLHIPFPSPEIFSIDPHAAQLIEGLLGADLVGFQTDDYAYNFVEAVANLTPHRYSHSRRWIGVGERMVRVGDFPISIDFDFFESLAASEFVERRLQEIRSGYRAEYLAIGVDRLDYSKGILERLRAIELMLASHEEMQGRFTFIQLSAPSRTKVDAYQAMREKIEQMVGHINGRFGGCGCIPIDYRYESYSHQELLGFYRAADVALVTPLRDGMNLVAKEYVASRIENDGALVLSRFAGSSSEMTDAVLVNPYDLEATAEQIYGAILMPHEEKARKMRRLRDVVRRNDIYWWLERLLREMG